MNKILVYADIDMNEIDGSTIGITSIVEMFAKYGGNSVMLLLKKPIEKSLIINQLLTIANVEIVNIWGETDDLITKKFPQALKRRKLSPHEALEIIEILDNVHHFTTIFIRGKNVILELNKFLNISKRCIIYSTGFTEEQLPHLLEISNRVNYMACQTEELIAYYLKAGVSKKRLFIWPPMIPDIDPSKIDYVRHGYKLIYAGKFSPGYHSLEIIDGFNDISKLMPHSELALAGDKFLNRPFVESFNELLKAGITRNKQIKWYQGIPRATVYNLISKSDLGISWRSEEFNTSMEISTKLLEYGSLGKPILVNRTPLHVKLFGEDYPLFVNSKTEFIAKTMQCFASDEIYKLAAQRTFTAAQHFSMKNVYRRIKGYLRS